jgi:drug/metabolite transporter (DMT)-like permease
MSRPVSAKPRLSVHAILVVVQFCFASLAVVGRLALGHVPPNALMFTRVAGGALVFYAILRFRGSVTLPERKDVPRLVACALLGIVLNQFLFLNGLARSTATNASVLGCTIPVFTLLVAALAGVERPTAKRLGGIAVALLGTLVLVGVDRFDLSEKRVLGNFLVVCNSLSYGSFLVAIRPLSTRYPAMTLVTWLFLISVPFAAITGVPTWIAFAPEVTVTDGLLLAFLVAVPTVGAYSLNQLAIGRAESSVVAAYVYLQPVIASVGARFLLGETPTSRTLIAAALIFLGLWLSARGRPAPIADTNHSDPAV